MTIDWTHFSPWTALAGGLPAFRVAGKRERALLGGAMPAGMIVLEVLERRGLKGESQ